MSKVDWSLAPEDATHAGTKHAQGTVCWYKLSGDSYHYWYMVDSVLDNCGWDESGGRPCHWPLIERPAPVKPWSGPEDGLPPVGEQIDIYEEDDLEWVTCKVVYVGTHDGGHAVIGQGDDVIMYGYNNGDIRKPRTAAKKRETAIRELMDIAQVDCRVTAARLVDAGFKREVV